MDDDKWRHEKVGAATDDAAGHEIIQHQTMEICMHWRPSDPWLRLALHTSPLRVLLCPIWNMEPNPGNSQKSKPS